MFWFQMYWVEPCIWKCMLNIATFYHVKLYALLSHTRKKLRWNDMDKSMLPNIVWMHVHCCDLLVFSFWIDKHSTSLPKTMNQRNVELIDNTTNTISPFCILSKKIMFLTWSISIKYKVLHLCLAYLDKLPFSNLNQAYSFSFHILSLMV